MESQILKLQADIIERDQILLRNDMEIARCPEVKNENCSHLTLMIAKKICVELDEKDVVSAERVGTTLVRTENCEAPRPGPLVVCLARRVTMDAIL